MLNRQNLLQIISILFLIFLPIKIRAQSYFDPNFILSDHDLTNHQFLSQEEIQLFLEKKGGGIKNYQALDLDGKKKLASEIIFNASQKYLINPAVLLTILQKEKTLITHPSPSEDQYNWAAGFGCYDGRSPVKAFKGFAKQIDRAAWRLRFFLDHPWEFRFKAGEEYLIDKTKVSPINQATAALYNYTPHIAGNKLFFTIWKNWFALPYQKNNLEGKLVRLRGENGVWLIQNNKRRPFYSKNVFLTSYRFKQVEEVALKDLEKYEKGEPMKFPNYSLVKTEKNNLYLLVGQEKRPITEEMFKKIGFHPEEVIKVEKKDLEIYLEGKPIRSPYPAGALLQDKKTKGVYYVKDEIKYPLIDKTILQINFPYETIIKIESEELAKFEPGEPLKLKDGTLIKIAPESAVFLVSQEKKMPILSADVFEALGYEWEAIIEIPEKVSALLPLGKTITLQNNL